MSRPSSSRAKLLAVLTPDGLDHVFFSDSGSTSVEVALKMALGLLAQHRRPRAAASS